ncbi:MAG: NERD domain-containing protein [Erysipelotrichales bacterium]|nr:NERD domain-containing protein [Erysipelotrichales bacterium]
MLIGAIIGAIVIIIVIIFVLKNKSDIFENHDKNEREKAGKLGENIVAKRLNEIAKKYDGYLFNEFIFKDRYNENYSTEIDHILITRGGVFVVETKYYTGIIYGKESDKEWVCFKQGNRRNETPKNPLNQNQTHIRCLKRMFVNIPPKMISVVIILRGDISEIESNQLYNLDGATEMIETLTKQNQYSQEFVERIHSQILYIKNNYSISKEEHLKNIRRNHEK